ncbi:hypothetical protein [Mycolicibacterium elephantis]|uniref:hypothetical protein n=1 Tax=Mycolicibacterium elephantis TaxID=81858 RepID=UPI000AFE2541
MREAFRAQLVHNAGGPPPSAAALAPLRAVAARATAHARVGDAGPVRRAARRC